jgi:phosphatidylserine/phosphatidylglycerophosphate/cardiolipin synthase-like enzyme
VHIHHKFIIIDAETDAPTIYSGSANLSNNSTHKNDENLLEIKGNPELARTYFAEFLRLYEHYRARALWNLAQGKGAERRTKGRSKKSAAAAVANTFTLKRSRDAWAKGAYTPGTPEFRARTQLAGE